jgi:glucans biosynthesis protein
LVAGAAGLAAAVTLPAIAAADTPPPTPRSLIGKEIGPFDRSTVIAMAKELSAKPFAPPPTDLPAAIANLTYDQYRAIQSSPDNQIFKDENLPFRLQFFHRGFYYKEKIDVSVVSDGKAYAVPYTRDFFAANAPAPALPDGDIGFAGIRLLGHINDPDRFDEVAVFLGASYFRSLGKNQNYGLSARGLALKTADPSGEEFPLFRAFWVETPVADSDSIVVHALLDSQSVAGAYRFSIRPGDATVMDVESTLFPRVTLDKVGIAPASTMFYFDANGRENVDDWRPEVHDSNGLLMAAGSGETIWRPLANPKNLQVSAFVDAAPRGFGLMQRDRNPSDYQDLEARYETRPSLWVEPVGDWGTGTVSLIEIPSDSEINDNIVAYWAPHDPLDAGGQYQYAYRLNWGDGPREDGLTRVVATRRGKALLKGESPVRRFVIDFKPPDGPAAAIDPKATVTASAGTIADVVVYPNPLVNGWRMTFTLDPGNATTVELRAVLALDDARPAETWLYRWTA